MSAESRMEVWPTGRLLSVAARAVEGRWYARLEEAGLSHAGLVVLDLLREGPSSQVDLATRARVQVQTMSRTVTRLERDGLVERLRDEGDARKRLINRTPAGEAAWREARTLESGVLPTGLDEDALRQALLRVIAGR